MQKPSLFHGSLGTNGPWPRRSSLPCLSPSWPSRKLTAIRPFSCSLSQGEGDQEVEEKKRINPHPESSNHERGLPCGSSKNHPLYQIGRRFFVHPMKNRLGQSSHGSLKSIAPASSGWSIRLVAPSNSSLLGRFSPPHRALSTFVQDRRPDQKARLSPNRPRLSIGFNHPHWSGHTPRPPAIPCLPPWICQSQSLRDSLPSPERADTRLGRCPWSERLA